MGLLPRCALLAVAAAAADVADIADFRNYAAGKLQAGLAQNTRAAALDRPEAARPHLRRRPSNAEASVFGRRRSIHPPRL